MSSNSLGLYACPALYGFVMRLLYGRHFEDRYRALAAEVPSGAQVVDVCAGDAYLYRRYLRSRSVDYLALDISPQMVAWACRRGINARVFDLWTEAIPPREIIILQASLYQFTPNARAVVERLLAAARHKLLLAEPVVNLSCSSNPLLARLGSRLTVPRTSQEAYVGQRFNPQTFEALARSFPTLEKIFPIPGGRECVAVFTGLMAA